MVRTILILLIFGQARAAEVIRLRVIDSFTAVPIVHSQVALQQIVGANHGAFRPIGSGTNGVFTISLTNPAAIHEFEVSAENYGTYRSRRFTRDQAQPFQEISLERLFDFEGVIIAPSGHTASGARSFICTDLTEVTFRPDGSYFTRSRPPAVSGPKAQFHLSPDPTGHSILAAHDLGYARIPLAGWTNGMQVILRPWGRVAGRMLINGKPVSDRRLTLQAADGALGRTKMTLLDFNAVTDKQGRFAFENVPPVEVILACYEPSPVAGQGSRTYQILLQADAIKTSDMIYELRGPQVTGKLSFQDAEDATQITALLIARETAAPLESPDSARTRFERIIPLQASREGTISGGVIPAGGYILDARIFFKRDGAVTFKQLRGAVRVPDASGRVDLGTIPLR